MGLRQVFAWKLKRAGAYMTMHAMDMQGQPVHAVGIVSVELRDDGTIVATRNDGATYELSTRVKVSA